MVPGSSTRRAPHEGDRVKKAWIAAPLILLAVAVPGCSFRRIALRHLDWVVERALDRTFSLGPEQERALGPELEAGLADLRRDYLPRLRALILSLRAGGEGPLGRARIEAGYDQVSGLYEEFLRREAPGVGRFLSSLGEAQIASLEKDQREHNRKRFDEAPGGEGASRQRHAERLAKQVEDWVGGITGEQRLLTSRFSDERFAAEMRLRGETVRSQRELAALLRSRPGAAALADYFVGTAAAPYPLRAPAWNEEAAPRRSAWVDFLAALDATLSSPQR
jgi:hypothetical protein